MKTKNIILVTMTLMFATLGVQHAEADEPIKGANATMVVYTDPGTGKDIQINMDPENRKQWYERSPSGSFTFTTVMRDEWSVYLHDAKRGMVLQINLHTKKITYGEGGIDGRITSKFGEYPIKHAQ